MLWFKKIKYFYADDVKISGHPVYTAVLEKGTEKLYSAWWYDNGNYQTINQTDWRWKAFKGEKFNLVNLTCGSENELLVQLKLVIGSEK